MPSILFHELIGYEFAKKYNKFNDKNFFLGVMVPDAVNAYGFASKEKRWAAHFRDKNLNQWTENIINFYNKLYGKYDENYLVGYLIHVLTDIICDEIYKEKIYQKLLKEGYNYETAYSHYNDALIKLENSNINEKWWENIKNKIIQADKIEINNINKKMIEDWIDYVIKKYNERNYEPKGFIDQEFINEVLKKLEEILLTKNILLF